MIRAEIKEDEIVTLFGPFQIEFLRVISKLSGRKKYAGSKFVSIEGSASNIKVLRESGFDIEWTDNTGLLKQLRELEMMATQHQAASVINTDYVPRVPYLKHMDHCIGLSWERKAYGYFLEMGLCKTAITIHVAGILFKKGLITGMIIFAPKGVHCQWIMEQIPEHLDASIKVNMTLFNRKEDYKRNDLFVPGTLNIFALNIDSARAGKGQESASLFIRLHQGKSFMVVDESHDIKTYASERTRNIISLGEHCTYRRILTGTPLSLSLEDMWSQFLFLDPKIFGIEYLSVFRARFCEMSGGEYSKAVGSKNIEEFYQIIAPHSYRLTKVEALDLPPKLPASRQYEMDTKTSKHYEDLRHAFMTQIDNGEIVAPVNALSCIIKLQQLLSGYITRDDRSYQRVSTQRADLVLEMTKSINGPVVIWAKFIEDINILSEVFAEEYGDDFCLLKDIELFKLRKKKYAFLNPASGGTGLNLQVSGCLDAIYYNNSNRAIHRWQSEDRIWRMGTTGTVNIWDIFARNACCRSIFNNLKEKKDLADLALDDIRKIIAGS